MEALKFRKAILLVSLCLWTLTVFPQVKEDTIFQSDYLLILNTYTSDAPWSNAIISPVPVSYTHLTLPTNSRV